MQQQDGKRRHFKPDVRVVRPPNGSVKPRSRTNEKTKQEQDPSAERAQMAHEELRQLNHKKLQFLLKQETRNHETIRRLVDLVNSLCNFFKILPRTLQYSVCKKMKLETFVRNEVVFTAGDAADKFFIVASGKVEICVNDVSDLRNGTLHSVAVLQRGDSFGEVALMLDTPRTATVVVLSTRVELLSVSRDDFQQVLHDLYGISVQERLLFFRSLAMFQSVRTFKLEALAHKMQAVVYEAGTTFDIMREGMLYFVVEGECRLRRAGPRKDAGKEDKAFTVEDESFYDLNTITRLGPGDFFGETSVFAEVKQEGWYVEAHSDCKLYCISGAELINTCVPDIVDIMRKASQFKLDYYKDRLARMDEQRKSIVAKALPRTVAKKSSVRAPPAVESIKPAVKPAMISSPPIPTRPARRGKEEVDEDEQEVSVLDELKQHILESALALEKQRLEVYNRGQAKSKSSPNHQEHGELQNVLAASTINSKKLSSRNLNQLLKQQDIPSKSNSPIPDDELQLEQKHNAYPRENGRGRFTAKEALSAAGGLQYLPVTPLNSSNDIRLGQPKEECSGYMTTGEPGYIGYDTKHMRANVASRDPLLRRPSPP